MLGPNSADDRSFKYNTASSSEMNIFLFQLEFSSVEPTEAFNTFSDPANSFLCQQKTNYTAFKP